MRPLVLFHANCSDGLGAAVAAYGRLGNEAEYLAVQYGSPPPPIGDVLDRIVYLLDFSYPRQVLESLAQAAERIVLLDHHATAQADLQDLPYATFDMSKSGAMLAWEHFHETEPPELIQYIQDRDLWHNRMPHTREVTAYLRMLGYEMPGALYDWADLLHDWSFRKQEVIDMGVALVKYQTTLVKQAIIGAQAVQLGGHHVLATNATAMFSEIAGQLAQKTGTFGIAWFWDGRRQVYQFSLRAVNGFDVSAVAQQYGGGGHVRCAGFTAKELPWTT